MSWIPVYINKKPELEVFKKLLSNNFTVYLPLRREMVFGENGYASTVVPVIKGHMFIQTSSKKIEGICKLDKDLNFISSQDKIVTISDGHIKFLKDLLRDDKTAFCKEGNIEVENLLNVNNHIYGEINLGCFVIDEREYASWEIKELNKIFLFDLQGSFYKCLKLEKEFG